MSYFAQLKGDWKEKIKSHTSILGLESDSMRLRQADCRCPSSFGLTGHSVPFFCHRNMMARLQKKGWSKADAPVMPARRSCQCKCEQIVGGTCNIHGGKHFKFHLISSLWLSLDRSTLGFCFITFRWCFIRRSKTSPRGQKNICFAYRVTDLV